MGLWQNVEISGVCDSCAEQVSVLRNIEPDIPDSSTQVLLRNHKKCDAGKPKFTTAKCRKLKADEIPEDWEG